jgi:hypothetical protein
MFLENWRLDQALTKVEYQNNNAKNGAIVTIDNLEKVAMPVVIEYETVSGTKGRVKLPVEVWQSTATVKTRIPVQEELKRVTIDPDKVFPDYNGENNTWTANK